MLIKVLLIISADNNATQAPNSPNEEENQEENQKKTNKSKKQTKNDEEDFDQDHYYIQYGADTACQLKQVQTGFNDEFAYGVKTRTVAMSRGGREGNNAFVGDLGARTN
jgi:hypothetical protein